MAASSRGLGRAIATALAAEGAKVMVSARDEAVLRETAREIGEVTGAEVDHQAVDLVRADDIRALVGRTAERFGGVDVLVTNAGGPPAGTFDTVGDEHWRSAFELNLMSVVRLVREALPFMRERGGGRIVNIASSSIKQPIENLILSNTLRAGIAGLAKSLSFELAPEGILINTLGPGRSRAHLHRTLGLVGRGKGRKSRGFGDGGPCSGGDGDTPGTLRDARRVRQSCGLPGLPGQHLSSEVQNRLSYSFTPC